MCSWSFLIVLFAFFENAFVLSKVLPSLDVSLTSQIRKHFIEVNNITYECSCKTCNYTNHCISENGHFDNPDCYCFLDSCTCFRAELVQVIKRNEKKVRVWTSVSRIHYTYTEEGHLGEGAFGSVYRVIDQCRKTYALKVIENIISGIGEITMEIKALYLLDELFDYDIGEVESWIVMKYHPGRSVNDWLYDVPLTVEQVVNLYEASFYALKRIFDKGIVHRDTNLNNVIAQNIGNEFIANWVDYGRSRLSISKRRRRLDVSSFKTAFLSTVQRKFRGNTRAISIITEAVNRFTV